MRLRTEGARVIHSPLSFAFSMIELGGSNIQKYDTIQGSYNPNRKVTAYRLQPRLEVTDPDGLLVSGDYVRDMTNVVWTLMLYRNNKLVGALGHGTDYVFSNTDKSLTVMRNVAVNEMVSVDFYGTYRNPNSGLTSAFSWHKDLTTQAETSMNINMELRCPSKLNISPFKNYGTDGEFPIEAVIKNGTTTLRSDQSGFKWQVYDADNRAWTDIAPDECPWYVSGKDSGRIVVNVEYIQKVQLKVTGWPVADKTQAVSKSTMLRRWYGQWDDVMEYSYSAYIMKVTKSAQVELKIVRRYGNVVQPQRYFDMEMFFRPTAASEWKSRGNVTDFVITKDDLTGEQQAGEITREISAFVPLTLPDGTALSDESGNVLCGQFPTSEKEF